MNLVVNARDAMPKGGRVLVQTAELRVPAQAPPDRPNLAPGRYVCLTISDTGAGMDADTRNHVFEPFFSTKPRSKGTGLGLSIVYGIVKQSGGDIEVDSELGKGTTFRIWFPCWRPAPPRRRGAARK
jgi:signal transduction histidine kinase